MKVPQHRCSVALAECKRTSSCLCSAQIFFCQSQVNQKRKSAQAGATRSQFLIPLSVTDVSFGKLFPQLPTLPAFFGPRATSPHFLPIFIFFGISVNFVLGLLFCLTLANSDILSPFLSFDNLNHHQRSTATSLPPSTDAGDHPNFRSRPACERTSFRFHSPFCGSFSNFRTF